MNSSSFISGPALPFRPARTCQAAVLVVAALLVTALPALGTHDSVRPSRSTSIALSRDGNLLLNVNHEADSVSVFSVGGGGALTKLAELPVGQDPICVAVHPDGDEAYVTNAASGTVSVIALGAGGGGNNDEDEEDDDESDDEEDDGDAHNGDGGGNGGGGLRVVKQIRVGTEPHGCALTPNGELLYVANLTEGKVVIVDTDTRTVIGKVPVGGRPMGIAITNDGDSNDLDEKVFVTQFYAELIPNGPGEGFDDGKRGVVHSFRVSNPFNVTKTTLSPLADSGFTANRTNFCNSTAGTPPANQTFCPDTSPSPNLALITSNPQGVFPNQLHAALICGNRLYLPSIGAQPEPPVVFDTNVQALVHVVDTGVIPPVERTDLHVNLNAQIRTEPSPSNPFEDLDKLFGNDIVAIDSTADCSKFLIVSRGGNYVLRARLVGGKLNINAPNDVVRFQTGNIPNGVVLSPNGRKAYVNNQVNHSVSVLDLQSNTVLARDVPASMPPKPGSHEHAVLVGKLVFFTALGVPDNGLVGTPIREIVPIQFRGKQSSNAWSTCGSCHPSTGLSDGVTWIFPDGPRNTIPLDGTYAKINAHNTRINNWSAARDGVTDFNNNSRNVQCGTGFAGGATNVGAGCPPFAGFGPGPSLAIFDHGVLQGASEALDFETEWAQTVRPLNMPQPSDSKALAAGAEVFEANCASCHGGAKWTKSQVLYLHNPALNRDANAGGTYRDPGLTTNGDQIISYEDPLVDTGTLKLLEDVGTFDASNPIEIRQNGALALGGLGFNVPSLLSGRFHAPFFHNGAAQTLEAVFVMHELPGGGTIQSGLSAGDRQNLLSFLNAIDGRTPLFTSDTDVFKDPNPALTLP